MKMSRKKRREMAKRRQSPNRTKHRKKALMLCAHYSYCNRMARHKITIKPTFEYSFITVITRYVCDEHLEIFRHDGYWTLQTASCACM
jgi:hypothetical protein